MARAAVEFAVVGGGIVGACIADGMARRGREVTIFDEGDVAIRAARGNLGNVWVQGKGVGKPAYADLTRQAGKDWKALAQRLREHTGVDVQYRNPGAAFICLTDSELEKRAAGMTLAEKGTTVAAPYEMLDRQALLGLFPNLGPEVVGGSFSTADGTANPLFLLRALIKSAVKNGAVYRPKHGVYQIKQDASGFRLDTEKGVVFAKHIVLAAGLGNAKLAPHIGMFGGVRPVRGQIIVTERIAPFLSYGTNFIRQTAEGGCVIGESSEECGFDLGTSTSVLNATAQKAVKVFPQLELAQIVRAWSALRIMTRDGVPVYQMRTFGGDASATVVSVHSGVSLAPYHCEALAAQISNHALDVNVAQEFSAERFNVSGN